MNILTRILCAAVLTLAAFTSQAQAGRIGGPMTDSGEIAPGGYVYFDIPFAAGEQAAVSVVGMGRGNVDLYISDGSNNVIEGVGVYERREASWYVNRAGYFRVELRNTGNVPVRVLVGTN